MRFAAIATLALPALAAATVLPRTDGPSNQCNTGAIQCCNSVQAVSSLIYLYAELKNLITSLG